MVFIMYNVIYIAAKFFPRHIPFAATVLVFVYMVLARKMPTWYIVSSLSFPSGLLYCNYKQTIDQWLKLHFYSTFTLVLLAYIGCFTIIYLLQGHNHVLPYSSGIKLAFSFVHGVLFCGIMVLLLATTCMSTQLNKDTTANKFLSQNYLELYVMQGLAFNLLQNPYWHVINDWMYLICSISITFFLAILIHPIFQIVNKSIKKL